MRPSGTPSGGLGALRLHLPAEELREWVPKLQELDAEAPLTLVYFNNHFRGQAVHGARDLGQLLLGLE